MLDAQDPGELVEHATVSETVLHRGVLGVDALFIIGDEPFAYPLRPENGWGGGKPPQLRRSHVGTAAAAAR
jgi:hypothetical protein